MPKPLRALLGALAAAALLAACGTSPGAASAAAPRPDDRPLVLTTFTVIADLARNVAGEHLRVESLLPAGAEVHGYDPKPEDLRRAQGAVLVLDNGLGLERWFDQFIDALGADRVVLSEGVPEIPVAVGAYAGRPNPHAWISPRGAEVYVANAAAAFSALDPEHADDYAANAAAYTAQLRQVHTEAVAALAGVPEQRRVLVTCEGAFSYLARDLDLEEAYLWPVNADREGSPRHVASVIRLVRDREVPAVFCESTANDGTAQQVARESGSRVAGTLYVDSLSGPDGPVPTYLDLVRHDVEVIAAGLGAAS